MYIYLAYELISFNMGCLIILGDDCIAINNGSYMININGIICGPGHGIRFVCVSGICVTYVGWFIFNLSYR